MAQINKPTDYFNTVTYTGNGSSPRSITGVGFQPDFNWTKSRSASGSHVLANAVSGANKQLVSNNTNAEATNGIYGYLSAFDSDGWTMTTGSTDFSRMNTNSTTYVSWNWLAGGTASSNTDGSITSNVSANTTSGFSIVSYTGNGTAGATIGHGLGLTPKFIIVKGRDTASNWQVGHSSLGWTQSIRLNQDGASASRTVSWNDTDPTSSVFSVGTDSDCNTNTNDYIAYCFAEKKGFSKFGSYTGNGSADGTFVYTGFKPAWVMIKNSSSTTSWLMKDNKRTSSGFNPIDKRMFANETSAESTAEDIDFVSNGFKMRTSGANPNVSGGSFIYMCFAENPLVGTNNTPATAR